MSYVHPGTVLYFRSAAAIQPYRVNECAIWLVELGKFSNLIHARFWLNHLEQYHNHQFKSVMADYFDANIPRYIIPTRDVNQYHANYPVERYGEPHMA